MEAVNEVELGGKELWRRQCARNVMDCYALAMEVLSGTWGKGKQGHQAMEALTRLMVEGMTAVRDEEDEKAFYKMAACQCRECESECRGNKGLAGKAGLFRIYAAIFEDMSGKEG